MAISNDQLEYAKIHFTTLLPDLLSFPERHKDFNVYESKGHPFIDTQAIHDGKFDLITTVQATWEAYHHHELVAAQQGRQQIPDESRTLMNSLSRAEVETAYVNTMGIIIKHDSTYQTPDLNILPETVSAERMRPSLYHN